MNRINTVKRKASALAVCLLILPLILSGCMPYKEIKQELLVEGVGIDYGKDGYNLTFQIYKADSGDSKKGQSSNTVELIESSGASLFDAIRNATLQYGRKLFFSNTRAYVVGEDICKDNFPKVIDFMERNHEVRPGDHLFIAKGKAHDIMAFEKDGNIVPAANLQLIAQGYSQTSKIEEVNLLHIFKNMASNITETSIPAISILQSDSGTEIMEVDSTAVFKNGKLAGYLDKSQTRGVLWITGLAHGGNLMLSLPDGGSACMEVISSSSNISFTGSEKNPAVKAEINLKTNLTEIQSSKQYTVDDSFISKLMDIQNKTVSNEAYSAVNKALYEYGSDVFGFGQKIYQSEPGIWHVVGANWKANAKSLKVEITTKSVITHTGLTNKTAS